MSKRKAWSWTVVAVAAALLCMGAVQSTYWGAFGGGIAGSGNFDLDDGSGDSPLLRLVDADDKLISLQKLDAGGSVLVDTDGALQLHLAADTDDYLTITTTSNVPVLATVGTCDLKITSSSGNITFDNENLTTTGTLSVEDLTSTDDADVNDTLTVGDIVVDEAAGTLDFTGATSCTITSSGCGNITFGDENLTTTGTHAAKSYTSTYAEDTDSDTDDVLETALGAAYGVLVVRESTGGVTGVFRLENQTIASISANAAFTVTEDNAGTYNVYWDTDHWEVQNKVGDNKNLRVGFFGL